MAEDYYGDGDSQTATMPEDSEAQEESSESKTGLINSEICPGMKPGDKLVLRVVSVENGQYSVAYDEGAESPEEDEAEEEAEGEGEPAESSMSPAMYD
jgi:hypothetical protein